MNTKSILLKLSGTIFLDEHQKLSTSFVHSLITQIQQLRETHRFSIVIGGGNLFRGDTHGVQIGVSSSTGHQIGMLSTMINGLILKDLIDQYPDLHAELLCALSIPEIGKPISSHTINEAMTANTIIIFTGGTGNPFFTTDTAALLRGLQIRAHEVWKGTSVDGIYTDDPRKNKTAERLKHTTFAYALSHQLGIMDLSAYAIAEQYNQYVRIFDIFAPNALVHAAHDTEYGSSLTT